MILLRPGQAHVVRTDGDRCGQTAERQIEIEARKMTLVK